MLGFCFIPAAIAGFITLPSHRLLSTKRPGLWTGVGVITALVVLIMSWLWQTRSTAPSLGEPTVYTGALTHPAQVIRVGDDYLGGELFSNDIVLSESPGFDPHRRLVLREKDKALTLGSPHFFEVLDPKRVLVSEGWGSNIALIDMDSGEVRRFGDRGGRGLNSPHGICHDAGSGWAYVADSLHSRLLRYRPGDGGPAEVFADHKKLVSYGRQLLCDEDGLWLSNSYEDREGLNPGEGSNVLHINDFASGEATVIASLPEVNMTGLARLNQRWLVVGLWGAHNRLALVSSDGSWPVMLMDPITALPGPPYGLFFDRERSELLATYIGSIHDRAHPGGLAVYPVRFE
jgi:hypothetical protein|tara:strand:- start:35923 stop:36960 length:1038 start_codon:yes stop_codon:yes gene_type:complete